MRSSTSTGGPSRYWQKFWPSNTSSPVRPFCLFLMRAVARMAGTTLAGAAGLPTLTVLVPVLGDSTVEANESFALNVTGVSNATPVSLTATGSILDDDAPTATGTLRLQQPQIQVGEVAGSVQITVERTGGSVGAASVNWATSNGSAQAGFDYSAGSGTLNWAAGDASPRTTTLTIVNDPAIEPTENFYEIGRAHV